jgi:hypothetical protein
MALLDSFVGSRVAMTESQFAAVPAESDAVRRRRL